MASPITGGCKFFRRIRGKTFMTKGLWEGTDCPYADKKADLTIGLTCYFLNCRRPNTPSAASPDPSNKRVVGSGT